MATDKKTSQLTVATSLDGTELFPFAKGSDNGAAPASLLKGEKGDTGPQGEKGDTGAQGPQGEKGDDGVYLGMPIVEQTDDMVTIQPNVLNVWGEMESITIELDDHDTTAYAAEFCIEFVSGETATTLALPSTVQFPGEPTIEANTRYQISIVNNIALIAGVSMDTSA